MVFGRSNRPLPPGEGNPNNTPMISQQESLASLSELNGLLESALRMSGEDAISMLGGTNNNNTAPAPTTTTATYPPPPTVTDDSESTSSSWRLDTTRKLTAVSISHGRKDDAMIFHLHNSLFDCNAHKRTYTEQNKYATNNRFYPQIYWKERITTNTPTSFSYQHYKNNHDIGYHCYSAGYAKMMNG
eukprot:scaffold1005_cov96-Skeletonema_marinoi.AAC.2